MLSQALQPTPHKVCSAIILTYFLVRKDIPRIIMFAHNDQRCSPRLSHIAVRVSLPHRQGNKDSLRSLQDINVDLENGEKFCDIGYIDNPAHLFKCMEHTQRIFHQADPAYLTLLVR